MRDCPRTASLPVLLLSVLGSCGSPPGGESATGCGGFIMPTDVHSHARPDEARVTHIELDLSADFDNKVLSGTAALSLTAGEGAREVVLDTDELDIDRVVDGEGRELPFRVGQDDEVLGAPLTIDIRDGARQVVVHYRTRPTAEAVQWLEPRQTSGDRPFLFTQGQAILTRSWIPLQDSPGVRTTYAARIVVPQGLRAVMSARQLSETGEPVDGGVAYRFEMPWAIPGYLIALAIGELEFAELGPRTGVYAEPAVIQAAAAEFVDTEQMLEAAERLYGPYGWGRYDLLVLPASFPFGGMENPCLTFATPTIIAGDRSLVSLVAHELAHSWSGNLVTNATWNDFWLNEGFTVYLENRIMEELFGADYARMLRVLGWQDLQEDLDSMGRDNDDTRLQTLLQGRNPDDAFSDIPYEKGALFLRTIEDQVGRERFDRFLTGYFETYKFQAMTSERLVGLLESELYGTDASGFETLNTDEWIHAPGLPASAREPRSDRFARVDAVRATILEAKADPAAVAGFTTHEWLHLLRGMPQTLDAHKLGELDQAFELSTTGNSEILFEWLRICIRNRYETAFPALEEFLTRQGRRKFLKPLYQDLCRSDWGTELARTIYAKARPGYHSVSYNTIDEVMEKASK